jgi:ribosomal protein S1
VTDFGMFVELFPGVDGLLHTSEIPRSRQGAMREAAAAGAEITVMIVAVDIEKRRVALALAPDDALPGAEVASSVTVGAVLTGTIERVEPFGVFVRLGPGQTGLVPSAELGTTRAVDPRKSFPIGSELKVLVLGIEENGRRIRLSHAKALEQEERNESQGYIQDSKKSGGFGLTLGERVRRTGRL